MLEDLIKALQQEDIGKYKIIHTISRKEEFKLVYGKKSIEEKDTNKIYVRFLWDNSIKEFTIYSLLLPYASLIQIIKLIKKNPSEKMNIKELNYDDKPKIFIPNTMISNLKSVTKEICNNLDVRGEKYNIVLSTECSTITLVTPRGKIQETFHKNKITYLDLNDNQKFYNIALDVKDDFWKVLSNRLYKEKYQFCEQNTKIIKNTSVNILAKAFAKILNKIVELFHADKVFNGVSIFSLSMIGTKISDCKTNLISLPIKYNYFDSEGNFTKKKYLIKKGYLSNFLSNSSYSNKINEILPGEANVLDPLVISNQRIMFRAKYEDTNNISSICILSFEPQELKYDSGLIIGKGRYLFKEKIFKSTIEINVMQMLNSIRYTSRMFRWEDNVFVSDIKCLI